MPNAMQQLIDRVGGQRRALILAVGAGAVLLIFGLAQWATAPTWVPVFSGLPLEAVSKVSQQLDEAGIAYRLENGGSELRVAASDLARARVTLASQGLPTGGRPGLELFDQPSWGMTDFTQRINYRRAMEGELERTIGKMRGIETAQVHLSIQEQSSFRRADRPAEASVVLKLKSGASPTPDVVQGIAHLVASSVDGLETERVTVLDDGGRLLSSPHDAGSLAGLSNRQLEMQREVESYLEGKAEQIVSQIVGPGNARIQVSAAINFDRVERTVQSVDPDRQALASEQKAEIIPGTDGGAGSTNSAVNYENSRSMETFSGATGNVKRLTVAVLVNDRLVAGSDPVRYEPRSEEELARIETLVRSAVGLDMTRGDVVSVVGIPFDGVAAAPIEEPATDVVGLVHTFYRPVIALLGLLLAFVIVLRVLRSLRAPEPQAAPLMIELPTPDAALPAPEPVVAERLIPAANTVVRDRAVASVEEQPEVAARLVRAWLREA